MEPDRNPDNSNTPDVLTDDACLPPLTPDIQMDTLTLEITTGIDLTGLAQIGGTVPSTADDY